MTAAEMSNAVDRLIDLAGHTDVVEHVPGKIHLKVRKTGISIALGFVNIRASIRGILGASGSVPNRSIVINYDEKVLPKELWDLLLKSHANPKIRQLVKTEILSRVSLN